MSLVRCADFLLLLLFLQNNCNLFFLSIFPIPLANDCKAINFKK